jgi:uncharacterized protein YecE (DUF72 family)
VRTTVIGDMADASEGEIAIYEGHPSRQPIRIGCAGWNIPREAAAHFTSRGSHLQRYSQVFNCCEINSSFYRPHKDETWERWARTVPADFRFSVKAPRTITHEAALNCAPEVLLAFLRQVTFLGDKLGPVLIQLPPSLEFEYARARKFLSLLRDNFLGEMVWEPRHVSWFDDRVDDLLKEFQAARVAADPARVPAASRPGGLANLAYFRLHGSPRMYYSAYTDNYLRMLAAQLTNLAAKARVWCVFDNTASGYAIQNALQLTAKLKSTSTTRE